MRSDKMHRTHQAKAKKKLMLQKSRGRESIGKNLPEANFGD